jgi:NAD(P)-dependent dehydrogenase (short-subunit alcohol dehydrogenase family)
MPQPGFRTTDIPTLTGRVAIVTGPKRGLGLETVRLLASAGCTVHLAGRGLHELEATISSLKATLPSSAELYPLELDLSSTTSAVAAARAFTGSRLDIIVANAAISLDNNRAPSDEGWERHFQTNHLGHFAFVTALMPLLERDGGGRVVVTSSEAYRFVDGLDFNALQGDVKEELLGFVGGMKRYGASKLANMLFARELARRLAERGIENIYVNSCHPGECGAVFLHGLKLTGSGAIASTGLGGSGEQLGLPKMVAEPLNFMIRRVAGYLGTSAQDGAMTQVWAATSERIVEDGIKGQYITPVFGWTGRYQYSKAVPVEQLRTEGAKDAELAKRLWEVSEKAVEDAEKVAASV